MIDEPVVQAVYWLETSLLAPGDPEPWRAVVVLAVPTGPNGTVSVVVRSGADAFGVAHPAEPHMGLSAPGRFSRRLPVQARPWTAAPLGRLDNATFAAIQARFSL